MKTRTLLLGIAIVTSQINPLVCMDETEYASKEETTAQSTCYTYRNFEINHFSLGIGVDPNRPYDMDKILADLFEQQKYVSKITSIDSELIQVIDDENTSLTTIRNTFFEMLTKYQNQDEQTMKEIDEFEGPINWIMHQVTYYNKDVTDVLSAFAKAHTSH